MSDFAPKSWNADERNNADGSRTTKFSSDWVNRLQDGKWEKIDLKFEEDGSGFHLKGTPYGFSAPKLASGESYFEDCANYNASTGEEINAAPFGKIKQFTDANSVVGKIVDAGVLYEGAFSFGDLLLTSHQRQVKYLVVFNEEPAGNDDIEIPFVQVLDKSPSVKLKNGTSLQENQEMDAGGGLDFVVDENRSIHVRPASVWDSAGKRVPITVLTKKKGKRLDCRKIIPRSFLQDATYPVYTDTVDSFVSDVTDRGMVSDGVGSFANYRSGTGLTLEAENSATLYAVNWFSGGTNYTGYRSYVWWATGATIPSNNVVTAASIDVTFPDIHAAISRTTYCVENRQAADTLATSDWTRIGASGVGTGTDQPYASITRSSGEAAGTKTFTLNSAGKAKIAKGSGNTYFAFISAYDWDNSAPPNESTTGSNFKSADSASDKPTLSVTHVVPFTVPTMNLNQSVKRASFI